MAAVPACFLVLACSCKGRTADNMVPTGDTVEVYIDSAEVVVAEATDSVAAAAAGDSIK